MAEETKEKKLLQWHPAFALIAETIKQFRKVAVLRRNMVQTDANKELCKQLFLNNQIRIGQADDFF